MRGPSHGPTFSMPGESFNAWRSSGGSTISGLGAADGGKAARKGSIRNAVRRIFGRKRRTIAHIPEESASGLSVVPRHTYHQSEPIGGLAMHAQVQEPNQRRPEPERMLSVRNPDRSPPPAMQRTGSPFAVSFPKSAMLKPMDLGTTFLPVASPELRRRVTLPSVQAEEEQAEHDKDPIDHATDPARAASRTTSPDFEGVGHGAVSFSNGPTSPRKRVKRRSRSIDDIIRGRRHSKKGLSKGNRNSEIHVWRQSYQQSDVMRTSGFYNHNTTKNEPVEQAGESEVPKEPVDAQDEPSEQPEKSDHHLAPPPMDHIPCTDIPVRGASLRSTGSQYATADELNQHSSPDRDHESDHPIELESRIANLEAGLSSFQTSLNRLTSSRNRRTIVVGQASNPRSPTSDRTPSMLADTLDPFTHEYEYIKALHPTSPHGLPPTHTESLFNHPPNKALPRHQVSPTMKEFPTPPRSTNHHTPSNSYSSPTSPTQAHTFRSLYLMLSTERNERRKLESDLRTLQGQVQDLTARLSVTLNNSQHLGPNDTERDGEGDPRRSSYLLMGSSARLQQLLDETDSYPESSPSSSIGPSSPSPSLKMKRSSDVLETGAPAVMMSRFSGSESELGVGVREMDFGISSEGETPFETPGEERVGYNFDYGGGDWQVREREGEAEMF
ncbi:hypothetical protein TI39_contig4114g00022 [Zymoseptoria brevis]|uniref:Uncharacterized protein n=1 Tax=Zymoseptoria brevis TaxID=1047168 RepID=A0A0F4GDD7_9PEZI|nr:hypothetical protein TI39_contig4114g00022 [Zymoseptoria brevis]